MATPYQILGLKSSATQDEARKAWRKKVQQLHPDLHPEDQRDDLHGKIAEVNQAWEQIRKGWSPTTPSAPSAQDTSASEISLPYGPKDANIKVFLDSLLASESAKTRSWWFKNLAKCLVRFKFPKRDPLTVLFCAAISIEHKTLTYVFHAPIPAGRVALIMPRLKKIQGGIDVRKNEPHAVMLEPRNKVSGVFSPFDDETATNLNLDTIQVSLPNSTLDRNKILRYIPQKASTRFMYRV